MASFFLLSIQTLTNQLVLSIAIKLLLHLVAFLRLIKIADVAAPDGATQVMGDADFRGADHTREKGFVL